MTAANSLSASATQKPGVPNRYTVILGTFLPMLAAGIVIFSFGVFFKPVSAQFEWTRAETSGAFSLALIISGLCGLLFGKLGDKFSPRLIIVICGALEGIAFLFLSQINSLWQLYLYFGILVGAGMANVIPASSLVARYFKKQRGFMTGITMSGAAVGSAITPPIATQLISAYHWSTSYIIIGLTALVITGAAAIFLYLSTHVRMPDEPAADAGKVDGPNSTTRGLTFQQALRSWDFWCLGLILFCAAFAQQSITVHTVPDATDIGISATGAALILTFANVACIFSSFILGGINDKIGGRLSMLISMGALFISSILLLSASSAASFYLFAIVFGIAWGGTSTLRSTLVAELFGLQAHGVITGAILLVAVTGGTLGPILAGHIFDISGRYHTAFLLIIGFNLIGFLTALYLKYRQR
jgi:MFS family permease